MRKEIRETLEAHHGELSFEALNSMEYLEAVVNGMNELAYEITNTLKHGIMQNFQNPFDFIRL